MNRQQRRKRERDKKKEDKKVENYKVSQLEYTQIMNTINAVKMASLLILRNQGWGETRILRFSDKFNEVLLDVSGGKLSLRDISEVLEEETGLTFDQLKVE